MYKDSDQDFKLELFTENEYDDLSCWAFDNLKALGVAYTYVNIYDVAIEAGIHLTKQALLQRGYIPLRYKFNDNRIEAVGYIPYSPRI